MILARNFSRFFYKAARQPGYALRVFVRRLKAYFYYCCGKGVSSFPEAITLFLTHRCNLRCNMCGQWGEQGVTRKQDPGYIKEELALDELKGFIKEVSSRRPNITLFGGEPLLHKHCLDVIRSVKERKMHCLMITNGTLLRDFAKEFIESGLDELNVSIDAKAGLHDDIRGFPGLYDTITSGLKKIGLLKKSNNKNRPLVNLQCTITQYNYKHLEGLLDVASEVGADSLTFHHLIFLKRALVDKQKEYDSLLGCSSSGWEGFVSQPEIDPEVLNCKIEELRKKWKEVSSRGKFFTIDFYPNFTPAGLNSYYKNPAYLPLEYPLRCLSPWIAAYVFPDGELRPCLNSDYSFGSIKNSSFGSLWNNDKAISFRQMLKGKKIFPVCVRCTELYRY